MIPQLESVTPLVVKATKTSPSTMNMSNLTLTMSPIEDPSICRVTGDAISESWTSPLDNGINYCSLEDLIIGSGLNNTLGFKEFTSNWICLGYTLGSCTVTSLNRKI
uniref:Uncharacterized protein n=1 Tax=Esox lucius TaxID=8010 RepID=A0AAY5KV49_ESOLU